MNFVDLWHGVGLIITLWAAGYLAYHEKIVTFNMLLYIAAGYVIGPFALVAEYLHYKNNEDYTLYSWGTTKANEPTPPNEGFPKA